MSWKLSSAHTISKISTERNELSLLLSAAPPMSLEYSMTWQRSAGWLTSMAHTCWQILRKWSHTVRLRLKNAALTIWLSLPIRYMHHLVVVYLSPERDCLISILIKWILYNRQVKRIPQVLLRWARHSYFCNGSVWI